ncbi:ABC transporter permease [Modestobacter muralis]|uniref:ABC transporter permease n=1 Tax=Modestobacter muralis TaxID=1608614 RepID=A0A6P0ERZ0_9ACTN|nr:FtsX-like permease family protein [Modestobacter muralis]NEK93645.1 ABC transporter permease [Modestobacter muralis]NEN50412.1 ABC transporter permease [Modestobacter muralis]
MTRAVRSRVRRGWPGVQLSGVLRRRRADRWLLLLVAAVVALTCGLAVATPRLVERNADAAVRAAVRDAGSLADTTMTLPVVDLGYGPPVLPTDSAPEMLDTARRLDAALPAELARVLAPPVAAVVSRPLPLLDRPVSAELGPVSVRMAWVAGAAGPAVTWEAGTAPGPPAPSADGLAGWTPGGPPPFPVQVALTGEAAAALGAGVGDHLSGGTSGGFAVDLVVTGVFRAEDPDDPAWQQVPALLRPQTGGSGPTVQTVVGGLLSAESLPAARLAVDPGDLARTVGFATLPEAVDAAAAEALPPLVGALQAEPASMQVYPAPAVTSRLGLVLTQARDGVRTAQAQAAVLVAGVVAGAALVLLLTAALLASRRRTVLATQRARGASLAAIGGDLAVESVVLAVVGGAVGVLAGALVSQGAGAAGWVVPVLVVAALATPVAGVLVAARATGGRRSPANRQERRRAERDRQLRRVAAEVVVVVLAAAAIATLRLRGVRASAADPVADLLVVGAPALGVAAGALVLLRVVPLLLRAALAASRRTRGVVPVMSAVQARATAGAGLPLLALTTTTGLLAVVAVPGLTVRAGQEAASWAAVGSEVTVTTAGPDAGLADLATALATRPGVEQAVPARVLRDTQLRVGTSSGTVTVLAVDPAAFGRLARTTPLPDVPDVDRLAGGSTPEVPVLVGAGVELRARAAVSLLVGEEQVPVDAVGRAPTLGAAGEDTVVVDAAALGAAVGGVLPPDTLWVVGPGAAAAVASAPELAGADVRHRQDELDRQRADPLTGGLTLAAAGAAGALALLAGAVVLLGAAGGAPARGRALATLRTLGLTSRQARRISLGELLPPVLLAALAGTGLGTGVAALVRAPLELQLLTGGAAAPALAVPGAALLGLALLVTVPLAALVGAVAGVESSARRRERLGEVLRVT